jgi:DNA-binding NarL/FixJ family response regulator
MRAYIEKQIQALPPKMRRVFQMSRNENLSHREIAERLGTTEDNVSKHVTNALRILRTKRGGCFTSCSCCLPFFVWFYRLTESAVVFRGHHYRLNFLTMAVVVDLKDMHTRTPEQVLRVFFRNV